MTLPKGFKQKDTKKAKIEDSKGSKENNKNVNSNSDQIKVTKASTDNLINKQENKIVAENITPKEQVSVDDISVDDGTATLTAITSTPTPEGEVLSETELKVPLQEREKQVLSETELKVMSPADSPLENEGLTYASRSVQNDANGTTTSTTTATSSNTSQVQQDQQHSVNRALDETKNNIRRATDEARKDIPRYTQAANEYQEQTIQTAKEIADNFLESQKEIINSLQSAWLPQIDAANRVFVSSWLSPTRMMEMYSRIASNFLDNVMIATKMVNNTVLANIESLKTSMSQVKDNSHNISRIGVNISKTIGEALSDTGSLDRGDPAQIPKDDVPGAVEKVVSQQGGIEGQRKEVNVESYSKTASLGQILKDLDFPTNRAKIIEFVNTRNPEPSILSSLQKIEDKQYQNVSEVAKSAGLVY